MAQRGRPMHATASFRARDEPPRNLSAEQPREPADYNGLRVVAIARQLAGIVRALTCASTRAPIRISRRSRFAVAPRQLQIARAQLALRGVIPDRRQQRTRGDLAGTHKLFDLEHANLVGSGFCISQHRVARAEIDADAVPLHLTHAFALPRTSNSTFQRSSVPRGTASSSSVPASVTRACSLTGTTSPAVRPAAGSVAWISSSSCNSSGPQKSSSVPT